MCSRAAAGTGGTDPTDGATQSADGGDDPVVADVFDADYPTADDA